MVMASAVSVSRSKWRLLSLSVSGRHLEHPPLQFTVQMSCGGRTAQPIAYFESPHFPVPIQDKLDCTLIVDLLPGTQQVLLEFEAMELRPPVNGDCLDDRFVVAGQNVNSRVPVLCGINTGQHSSWWNLRGICLCRTNRVSF